MSLAGVSFDPRAIVKPALVQLGYYSRPSFLIIGAAKCGTTALHRYLCGHPLIRAGWDKEIHFFDQETSYRRGLRWYHTRFPLPHKLARGGVTFEATPDYLYFRQCAQRIHRYDPAIKLIAVLRDPVERAYSFWNMLRNFHAKQGRPILEQAHRFDPPIREAYQRLFAAERFIEFDQMVRRELAADDNHGIQIQPNLVRYGLYAEQLQRYFKLFDRQQLLILHSGLLREDTRGALQRIIQFLELPACDWDSGVDEKVFEFPYAEEMTGDTRALLRDFYRPHNEALYELLGEDLGW